MGVFGLVQMAHQFLGACGMWLALMDLGVWGESGCVWALLVSCSVAFGSWLASLGGASAQVLLWLARRFSVSGAFGFSAGPLSCFFGAVAHVFLFSLGPFLRLM